MTIIDKEKLKSFLSGMDWFEELHDHNEYVFDENGIRVSNPIDADKAKSAFLTGTELAQIEQHEKAMRLDLPCTPKSVLDWAQRNDFADVPPDDFLETTNENSVVDNKSVEHLNEIDQVKKQGNNNNERDLTKWFRETWEKEGNPTGTPFFNALKKYVMQDNSPIREHYTTGPNGAGIRWTTGSATNNMTKKNIQTMASNFKRQSESKSCQ